MKKKVLYGVAIALFASVGMGTLQSCKDDVSDLEQVVTYDRNNLQKQIDGLSQEVEQCRTNCKNRMDQIEAKADYNASEITALWNALTGYVTATELQTKLNELKTNLENYTDSKITDLINNTITPLSNKLDGLETRFDTFEQNVNNELANLAADIYIQKRALEELQTTVASQSEEIKKLIDAQTLIQQKVADLLDQFDDLKDTLEDLIEDLQDLTANQIAELKLLFDSQIYGIIVEGTDSPVFGNFSLPLGIKSNLLFNWYGYNSSEAFDFPAKNSDHAYNQDNAGISAAVAAIAPKESIKSGYFGNAEDGVVLGKLYMTINPVGSTFDESAFKLESSAANEFPADLTVTKSEDELYFGYTRGLVEGNGFYEAEVKVLEEDIPNARITIDEGLKSSVKEIVKNPSRSTAYDLLKAVYNQFNGMLPAYAVRYEWEVEHENVAKATPEEDTKSTRSVRSGYDIAAATANPLSYNFLYGEGTSKTIPTFGSFQNFIEKIKDNPNLQFNFSSNISLENIKIELGTVEVSAPSTGSIKIVIDPITVMNGDTPMGETKQTTIEGDDITGFDTMAESIGKNMTAALETVIGDLNDQLKNKVFAELENQISGLIADMNETINGKIGSLIEDIANSSYVKRLDDLVSLYNKVANKINNFLANPNHYLQPAMFYNMGDGNVGILSNNPNDATEFSGEGYINLYASSYTAEIVAPAFKKYVVISKDVTDNKDNGLAALNAGGENLNAVFDGLRVGIPAANLTSKHVYEITYQAVDYSGVTSTQKFYIKVK